MTANDKSNNSSLIPEAIVGTTEFTRQQIEYLNARLREQKDELHQGHRLYFWLRIFGHILITLIPIAILALLLTPIGDTLGIRLGWFTLPPEAYKATTVQPKAILESMRDMLTVIVPLFLGIAIWLVTIVAERRLKTYDDTLSIFRDNNSKSFDDFRKEIRESEARIESKVETIVLAKVSKEAEAAIQQNVAESRSSFQMQTEASANSLMSISKELEIRFGKLVDTTRYVPDIGPLTSISLAHKKVSELFAADRQADAVVLTKALLQAFDEARDNTALQRPSGSLTHWFNLSSVLGKLGQEALALRVCLAGLEQQSGLPMPYRIADWPHSLLPDRDLLAHAIKYAATINAQELEALLRLSGYSSQFDGRADWNWRSYVFIMDGLDAAGRKEEAIKLANSYLDRSRGDADQQKILANLAQIMETQGKRDEAITLLNEWLTQNPNLPAAQVVSRLIDWELGVTAPENIIDWANRGIRDLAEEQPSAALGNLVYNRALSQDWLAHEAAKKPDCPSVKRFARAALVDYQLARDTGVDQGLHRHIDQRGKMLKALLSLCGDSGSKTEGDASPVETDDSAESVKRVLAELMAILSASEPNDETYESAIALLNKLSVDIQPVALMLLSKFANDESAPVPLREKLRWFLDRHN